MQRNTTRCNETQRDVKSQTIGTDFAGSHCSLTSSQPCGFPKVFFTWILNGSTTIFAETLGVASPSRIPYLANSRRSYINGFRTSSPISAVPITGLSPSPSSSSPCLIMIFTDRSLMSLLLVAEEYRISAMLHVAAPGAVSQRVRDASTATSILRFLFPLRRAPPLLCRQ